MDGFKDEIKAFMEGCGSKQVMEGRFSDIMGVRKDLNKLEDYCIEQWKALKKEIDEIKSRQKKDNES